MPVRSRSLLSEPHGRLAALRGIGVPPVQSRKHCGRGPETGARFLAVGHWVPARTDPELLRRDKFEFANEGLKRSWIDKQIICSSIAWVICNGCGLLKPKPWIGCFNCRSGGAVSTMPSALTREYPLPLCLVLPCSRIFRVSRRFVAEFVSLTACSVCLVRPRTWHSINRRPTSCLFSP